jgi:cell division protease FtsH
MFSQETAHEVDQAVRRLITEAEQKAAGIIGEHRPQIEHLVDELEARETLDRAQIDACLGPARERQGTGVAHVTAAA